MLGSFDTATSIVTFRLALSLQPLKQLPPPPPSLAFVSNSSFPQGSAGAGLAAARLAPTTSCWLGGRTGQRASALATRATSALQPPTATSTSAGAPWTASSTRCPPHTQPLRHSQAPPTAQPQHLQAVAEVGAVGAVVVVMGVVVVMAWLRR